jgi:hypothetical protein
MNRSWGSRQFSGDGETWRKRIKVRGFYTSVREGRGGGVGRDDEKSGLRAPSRRRATAFGRGP